MTLEVLSSIKGATSSKAVDELFKNIKNAHLSDNENNLLVKHTKVVSLIDLREDVVIASSETERSIIKGNFPKQKNGYLVVSKVIEN